MYNITKKIPLNFIKLNIAKSPPIKSGEILYKSAPIKKSLREMPVITSYLWYIIFKKISKFCTPTITPKKLEKNRIKPINIIKKINKNKSLNNENLRSLIRLSGTEPLVRILVEGKNKNIVKQNSLKIKNLVRPYLG